MSEFVCDSPTSLEEASIKWRELREHIVTPHGMWSIVPHRDRAVSCSCGLLCSGLICPKVTILYTKMSGQVERQQT